MQTSIKIRLFVLLAIVTFSGLIQASESKLSDSQQRGLDIAVEADRRNEGFVDSRANLMMILRNKRGDGSTRLLRVRVLEGEDGADAQRGDKSLMVFDTPRDQKGSALLTYSYKTKADDQWIYLPAVKRVKRIASRNKSGPFVGSEFAYEDFNAPEVEKYDYDYLRDERLAGQDCFVIERIPLDKYSGYRRQVVWLDQKEYRLQKIDFYDRKNTLLKTLTVTDYEMYSTKHWRAKRQMMVNHQTGKTTELKFSDFEFDTGLKEADFNVNSLKRAR